MTKRQLITKIRRCNTDVPPRFLMQFDPASLRQYLDHLMAVREKGRRMARWTRRQTDLRAVC